MSNNKIKSLKNTYQLNIKLNHITPTIWRRFRIDSTISLTQLHETVQIVMGWSDCHLHQFMAGGQSYSLHDPETDFLGNEDLDESKYRVNQLLKTENDTLIYLYDYGDHWEHSITLEEVTSFDPNVDLPVCIAAEGACPPEDVGGLPGYDNFLHAMRDKNHPEHAEYKEWIDGVFDPTYYDISMANQLLIEFCS